MVFISGVFNITESKTVSAVKQNNFKSKMPAIVDKKTFISANRFESLAVDDENDDNDIADRSVNPSNREYINKFIFITTIHKQLVMVIIIVFQLPKTRLKGSIACRKYPNAPLNHERALL